MSNPLLPVAGTLLALLVASGVARADEPASGDATGIVVERVRDPAMVPYRKGYELTRRVRDAAGGHVGLLFRVLSAKSKEPVPGLQIAIEGSRSHGMLDISPDGVFSLPLDEDAVQDQAEFVSNQKKGSLVLSIILKPELPREGLRYSMIVDAIQGARHALREIVPWYYRLFLPSVKGVGICFAEPGKAVEVTGDGAGQRQAGKTETDELGHPVHCARFSADEKGLGADSVIVAPAGWQAIFLDS